LTGARLALVAVLLAHSIAGAAYIERTSFERDGERVFVLWDDAMISMRYARNLAEGNGLVWNPGGERVQGYTNLGLTLVMAAAHRLPIEPSRVALAIQLLALATLLGTSLLAARMATDLSGNAWVGVAAAAALALFAPHSIYALQGADTIFVSALVLAALAVAVRAELQRRPWPAATFAPLWLAVCIRQDATLFAVCAAAVAIWAGSGTRPGGGRRAVAIGTIGVAGVWLTLVGFSLAYYGDPLPNTFYLKATGAPLAQVFGVGFEQLGALGLRLAPATIAVVVALACAPRDRGSALLALSCVAAAAYHVSVGGDWIPEYGSRHLVQAVPLWLTLAAVGCWRGLARIGSLGMGVRAAATVSITLGIAILANPERAGSEWFDPTATPLLHRENTMNFDRATYLRTQTRADTTVAVHWAGVGPYFAERTSIDVLGRSDRHIGHLRVDRFIPGHSKWDWDYVVGELRPDLIDSTSRGLSEHADFLRHYAVARIGPQAQLFVRRDSVDKLLDPDVEVLPLGAAVDR
jgi:hypothetical protein